MQRVVSGRAADVKPMPINYVSHKTPETHTGPVEAQVNNDHIGSVDLQDAGGNWSTVGGKRRGGREQGTRTESKNFKYWVRGRKSEREG